jgi:hypothetical protein
MSFKYNEIKRHHPAIIAIEISVSTTTIYIAENEPTTEDDTSYILKNYPEIVIRLQKRHLLKQPVSRKPYRLKTYWARFIDFFLFIFGRNGTDLFTWR